MGKLPLWKSSDSRGVSLLLLLVLACGCGTTRTSDTTRTATEQLLITNSMDNTVSRLDFSVLAGKRVYFDPQFIDLDAKTDKGYLISSIRQQLLANGCLLQEDRKNATYVVEARAGSVGTDRSDMLIGVPKMALPSVVPGLPGGMTMIPEIALAKKSNCRAVVKIAVFAFNRVNGEPVWQSGTLQDITRERDRWLCGAGPFRRGNLHHGTEFDDRHYRVPLFDKQNSDSQVGVAKAAFWQSGPLKDMDDASAQSKPSTGPSAPAGESKVIQASGVQPAPKAADKPK